MKYLSLNFIKLPFASNSNYYDECILILQLLTSECQRVLEDDFRTDLPFITDIVRKARKTRTVRMPEKLAIFGARVTYLRDKTRNKQQMMAKTSVVEASFENQKKSLGRVKKVFTPL